MKTNDVRTAVKKAAHTVLDQNAEFGPPDKREHFMDVTGTSDSESPPPKKKSKNSKNNEPTIEKRRDVEVLYDNNIWYRGWLSSFNFETGKWIVKFYDDDDTTEVNFPDKDVRLLK